jgi:type VI secretion system secreted protein Hcp
MARQDMFLKVDTTRQGLIKGEARDEEHKDQIDVMAWSWGMASKTSLGASGPASKATVNELHVTKHLDSASTALMSALRNNEEIKKAVLVCRKAGKNQHEFVKITIQKARLTALDVGSGPPDNPADLIERLSFSFQRVTVEYVPQGDDGRPRGGMLFETEIH